MNELISWHLWGPWSGLSAASVLIASQSSTSGAVPGGQNQREIFVSMAPSRGPLLQIPFAKDPREE